MEYNAGWNRRAQKRTIGNDDQGTTLFSGSRESSAFWTRRRGLSCLTTHAEQPDPKTRGVPGRHAHRAQCAIICADRDGTGGGREGATNRSGGRRIVVLDPPAPWTVGGAAEFGSHSVACALFSTLADSSCQGPLREPAADRARRSYPAPLGALA